MVFGLTATEIYRMVLDGNIKYFPINFWTCPEAVENAIEVTKYLFDEILKWDDDDIREKFNGSLFDKYKLGGMINIVYKHEIGEAFQNAFPGRLMPWEFGNAPQRFWNNKTRVEAIKWLIEVRLKWNRDTVAKNITAKVFYNNKLGGLLRYYGGSPYRALDSAYPNNYFKDEFIRLRISYIRRIT